MLAELQAAVKGSFITTTPETAPFVDQQALKWWRGNDRGRGEEFNQRLEDLSKWMKSLYDPEDPLVVSWAMDMVNVFKKLSE